MLKVFAFLAKRQGIAIDAFIEYYENNHVPLVLSLPPTPTVYKRNYVVRGDELNREDDTIDFDVVTELEASSSRSAHPTTGRAGDCVRPRQPQEPDCKAAREGRAHRNRLIEPQLRRGAEGRRKIGDLFDAKVDGADAAELGLAGKPDPAVFIDAARRLGVDPPHAAVVEDAIGGHNPKRSRPPAPAWSSAT